MQLTFAVPGETTTRFLVTVGRAPADAASAVPWRVSHPHRRQAAAALGTPWLTITCHPPSLVIVSCTASPSCQPRAALVARAAARAVAEASGGVVQDALTGRVFTPAGRREEPSTFRLTPDWLGWRVEPCARATDPAPAGPDTPAHPAAAPAWSVRTRGLCRFGLPELMLEHTGCAHGRHPFRFLHAVAERLLDDHLAWLSAHPGGGVRRMCDHLRIDRGDLLRTPAVTGRPMAISRVGPSPDASRSVLVRLSLVRCGDGRHRAAVPRSPLDADAQVGSWETDAQAGSWEADAQVGAWEADAPTRPRETNASSRSQEAEAGSRSREATSREARSWEARSREGAPPVEEKPSRARRFRMMIGSGREVIRIGPPVGSDGDPGGALRLPCVTCAEAVPVGRSRRWAA